MTTILLLGATGLVGREVLRQALEDRRVRRIVAPTRSALPAMTGLGAHKLANPVVDFEALPHEAPWWAADSVICTLGTTLRRAGSRDAFRRVDHDYVLQSATLARRHGARGLAVVTALGANARSPFFYPRVKGEVERAVRSLDFASLTIVRPNFIAGERAERRPAERALLRLLGAIGPILPRGWRINPAPVIARALIQAAVTAPPGRRVIGANLLTG